MRVPRWAARVVTRTTDGDLLAELQYHIDMRTERHVQAGLTRDQAEALAREQFGDMEAAMTGMRRARLTSPRRTVVATMTGVTIVAAISIYLGSMGTQVVFPQLPGIPAPAKVVRQSPPPPPPPPTWEEFVAKVNTFAADAPNNGR